MFKNEQKKFEACYEKYADIVTEHDAELHVAEERKDNDVDYRRDKTDKKYCIACKEFTKHHF